MMSLPQSLISEFMPERSDPKSVRYLYLLAHIREIPDILNYL